MLGRDSYLAGSARRAFTRLQLLEAVQGVAYEGSVRVPFLIAYPGKIKPGTVVHDALATVDFKPTLLGLLGLKAMIGADINVAIDEDFSVPIDLSPIFRCRVS